MRIRWDVALARKVIEVQHFYAKVDSIARASRTRMLFERSWRPQCEQPFLCTIPFDGSLRRSKATLGHGALHSGFEKVDALLWAFTNVP